MIVMSSLLINLFDIIEWRFCPFFVIFGLHLSEISMATPIFLWLPFAWSIVFHTFTLRLCLSLELRWVSWRQHVVGSCSLSIQPLCVFWLARLIHLHLGWLFDMWGLTVAILSFVFWLFCIHFFFVFLFTFLGCWFSMVICSVSPC